MAGFLLDLLLAVSALFSILLLVYGSTPLSGAHPKLHSRLVKWSAVLTTATIVAFYLRSLLFPPT